MKKLFLSLLALTILAGATPLRCADSNPETKFPALKTFLGATLGTVSVGTGGLGALLLKATKNVGTYFIASVLGIISVTTGIPAIYFGTGAYNDIQNNKNKALEYQKKKRI